MTSASPPSSTALATAPPARQTKSAECAPITCTRLGTGQPPRVVHRHRPDLLLAEAGREEVVGHDGQPVLDRRVEDLPEVAAPHGVLYTGSARGREHVVPAALARVRRRERALHQRALGGELALLGRAHALRRELGVGHHDRLHAGSNGGIDDDGDLGPRQVSRREHDVMPGDHVSIVRQFGTAPPPALTPGTGPGCTPASRRSSSKRTQTGTLPSGSASSTSPNSFSELTVGSHTIRAPWRAATSTAVAFRPPTEWLRVIVPSARTPGTAARTTAARSAVAV